MSPFGKRVGELLPTRSLVSRIRRIPITIVDAARLVVVLNARNVGESRHETKIELDNDKQFAAKLERLRIDAGELIGPADIGNASGRNQ